MGTFKVNDNYKKLWYQERAGNNSITGYANYTQTSGNVISSIGYSYDTCCPLKIKTNSLKSSESSDCPTLYASSQKLEDFKTDNYTYTACDKIDTVTCTWQWGLSLTGATGTINITAGDTDVDVYSIIVGDSFTYANTSRFLIIGMYYLDDKVTVKAGETETIVLKFTV